VSWKLTVRDGPKVRHETFDGLDDALAVLHVRADGLAAGAHTRPFGGGLFKEIEPVQQVVARLELAGPRHMRAGIDVRGDGSSEAWSGRLTRELIQPRDGESAAAALARRLRGE
jgi:hypothetical protein